MDLKAKLLHSKYWQAISPEPDPEEPSTAVITVQLVMQYGEPHVRVFRSDGGTERYIGWMALGESITVSQIVVELNHGTRQVIWNRGKEF